MYVCNSEYARTLCAAKYSICKDTTLSITNARDRCPQFLARWTSSGARTSGDSSITRWRSGCATMPYRYHAGITGLQCRRSPQKPEFFAYSSRNWHVIFFALYFVLHRNKVRTGMLFIYINRRARCLHDQQHISIGNIELISGQDFEWEIIFFLHCRPLSPLLLARSHMQSQAWSMHAHGPCFPRFDYRYWMIAYELASSACLHTVGKGCQTNKSGFASL